MGEVIFNFDSIKPLIYQRVEPMPFLQVINNELLRENTVNLHQTTITRVSRSLAESVLRPYYQPASRMSWETANSHALERMRREWQVDFDTEVSAARQAMLVSVNSLSISLDAKTNIRSRLDHTAYSLRNRSAVTEYDPTKHLSKISLSPAISLAMAIKIARAFGHSVNAGLIKSLVWSTVGHECGHVIDCSIPGDSAALRFADHHMNDFPIQYVIKNPNDFLSAPFGRMKTERFAGFFATDVIKGSGLSIPATADESRFHLTQVFNTPLNPYELIDIFMESIRYLSSIRTGPSNPLIDRGIELLNGILRSMLIANTHLAELYPLPKRAVEDVLKKAWQEYKGPTTPREKSTQGIN